jgi:hypothetical protein
MINFKNFKNVGVFARFIMSLFLLSYYILVLFIFVENYFMIELDFPIYTLSLFPLLISYILTHFFKKWKNHFLCTLFICFVIQWIIFLNVNPYPLNLNNKLSIVNLFPEKKRPKTQFSLKNIQNETFSFPIIVKPTVCSGKGNSITICRNKSELDSLLNRIKDKQHYLVQNFLEDYPVEIGVMYEKQPFQKQGKIVEIVEKLNVKKDVRFFEYGKSKQHSNLVNNRKLNEEFNYLSNLVSGLNVGRYDIRLKNMNDLLKGDYKILEVNGTMGFYFTDSINTTDIRKSGLLNKVMFDISLNLKWYFTRLYIGIINILTLKGYSPISLLYVMFRSLWNMIGCRDWENIYSLYS